MAYRRTLIPLGVVSVVISKTLSLKIWDSRAEISEIVASSIAACKLVAADPVR